MKKGTVKFFNHEKGFGFIKEEGTDQEVFVHKTGLIDDVHDDDEVEYKVEQGRKGLNAVDVRLMRD